MKLKLTISNETRTLHFDKGIIVVGSGGSHAVDLLIPGLKPVHMRFTELNGQHFVLNEANDPFVALNGLPFHKKAVQNKDLIEFTPEISLLIEDLGAIPHPTIQSAPVQLERKVLKPIKINDLEEESEPKPFPKGKIGGLEPVPFYKNFKTLFTLAAMAVILIAFVFGALYTRATELSSEEEITAAEAVSDIAMALMYAQVNHLKPKKHNWSDPDFIRNNLNAVITHNFPALSNLDSHGQFANTPYILRTYTNTEFSHFIVIAQPTPGVTQWLTPRTAIVIDSKLMQLKKIKDLRTLNRMLVNPTVLDGEQAGTVTALIEQGELIPLATVAKRRAKQGFDLPKALALFYPGAENRIYNAPRYYQFGESIIKRALSVGEYNQHELIRLHQEMEILSQLPNMVLYSSQGMDVAMETQRALLQISPDVRFISGYLKFNSKGNLISSNLILDSEVALTPAVPENEWIPGHKIIAETVKKLQATQTKQDLNSLEVRLQDMLTERREALQPFLTKLISAIECCIDSPTQNSTSNLDQAVAVFKTHTQQEDQKLRSKVSHLHNETPHDEYMEALDKASMMPWFTEQKKQ